MHCEFPQNIAGTIGYWGKEWVLLIVVLVGFGLVTNLIVAVSRNYLVQDE